jgi:hypothetical protein
MTRGSAPMTRAILYYFAVVSVLAAFVLLLSWYSVID